MNFFAYFIYGEFVVLALLVIFFIAPMRAKFGTKMIWFAWLAFCLSKFFFYTHLGGHTFAPVLPEKLLWFWGWAYSGAIILFGLRLVWWTHHGRTTVMPLLAWGIAAFGLYNGIVTPDVHRIELTFPNLPAALDGYRIVQLTDIHCSCAARGWRTRRIVEKANALGPNLICVTGDNVDGYVSELARDMAPLRDLVARDGVWYVRGNHEYYLDRTNWREWFRENGMRFLDNEGVTLRAGLYLGGVVEESETLYGGPWPDVMQAFQNAQTNDFLILMRHRPAKAREALVDRQVSLQLSGHTHGGICPIMSTLVAWHNGGFVRGLYPLGKGYLYVSPGTGQWAGFPLRLANPSEITLIVLKRGEATGK